MIATFPLSRGPSESGATFLMRGMSSKVAFASAGDNCLPMASRRLFAGPDIVSDSESL